LHQDDSWQAIENQVGKYLIRVYQLRTDIIRLDATVGRVKHDPSKHELFQIGKDKEGVFGPLFKVMLVSLDPMGMPLVVDIVPGNKADDPLYIPSYKRAKQIVGGSGKLIVGDSKMSAQATRATIVDGKEHYLTPLAHEKDEPTLLDDC